MNCVDIALGGKEYALLFNGYAMFRVQELFESESKMLSAIADRTETGFRSLCQVVQLLAEQGELAARYEGHEPREILKVEQILALASPLDCISLQHAVLRAVFKGYGREVEEVEKDLGLAELEQKKTKK